MILYIIKSSISLIVMFGLYWFLLRQEKLFKFNRFFLIFSILFSLSIPFVSIPVNIRYNESQRPVLTALNDALPSYSSEQTTINSPVYQPINGTEPLPASGAERINFMQILILLYITGALILLVRFIRNILIILHQMRMSEEITYSAQKLVLTDHQINPFCFFNTIFVSRQDFFNNEIVEDLLLHEIEHIRQSHSLDVIFIELIKIIYWFNPILILYGRAIRVNHEYLADNGVIRSSSDIKDYADKLLNYISCKRNVTLTSGFNPSLTRKRLIMLTKSKSNMLTYGARIFITLNLATALLMILSFTPSYSDQITPEQNMNVLPDKKSEIVTDINASQSKIAIAETETKKVKGEISIIQARNNTEKAVKGFVVNKYGKYLTGVPVIVSGKNTGAVTDAMGHFSLSKVPEDATLTFSNEGYQTQTLKPVFSSEMVVRLIIENESSLSQEKIISTYLPNFETNPLIVIDSVPVERESMFNIDPTNQVSSLIVLKGKEATEKYGENGKNGVIEISTVGNTWGTSEKNRSGKQQAEKLLIVDGVISTQKLDDIPVENVSNLSVLGNISATKKYGEKGKNGAIEITTKGKTPTPAVIKTSQTQNAESDVNMDGVVAVTNMNVLYLGIPNPVEIAVPGVTSDKVTATVTNGNISRTSTGWEVSPSSLNDLVLTILVNNRKVNEKTFRVKPIPAPVAVFAGKSNGSASKDVLAAGTLEAELKDFLWDLKFEIESFTFAFSRDGLDTEITSKGNNLTNEMKSIISDLKRGQYITIKDIKALGPDGRIYVLNPLILKID